MDLRDGTYATYFAEPGRVAFTARVVRYFAKTAEVQIDAKPGQCHYVRGTGKLVTLWPVRLWDARLELVAEDAAKAEIARCRPR
ncbi:MAG TPA: hypothetical protein VM031_04555 [Phycisphaerae bacterium]|nr:hypothetical protein [Phycisphaerae bacterium]